MEENNSFKNKSLSHIPKSVVDSMMRQETVEVNGMSPLEAIAKTLGKGPLPPKPEAIQQEKFMPLAVDGLVINVPADPFRASVVMISYILSTMAQTDKKIAKILDQFHFAMSDYNGIKIYPISAKQKRGKKK